MFKVCEALRPVVGDQCQQADDRVEGVVHGEQNCLHSAELVSRQVEVKDYTCGKRITH